MISFVCQVAYIFSIQRSGISFQLIVLSFKFLILSFKYFSANCNLLLTELGSPTGVTWKVRDVQSSNIIPHGDFAFLLAQIPRLGLEKDNFDVSMLRRIVQVRNDPDINNCLVGFRLAKSVTLGP